MDLATLVEPGHTTVLTMEMERGVVGDLARFTGPAEAARESGMIDRCAEVCTAARAAGMRVVHCIAAFRPDKAGSYRNMPAILPFMDDPEHLPVATLATGYHVVIPTDAVAGYPAEYGKLVLEHTLANIATLTTVAELTSLLSS
jgi:nicotinamidase-related amidase